MNIDGLIKVATSSREQKVRELTVLEKSGVKLPMSIDSIIAIEQRGDVVDLDTGQIIKGGAQQRFSVTEAGTNLPPVRKSVFKR